MVSLEVRIKWRGGRLTVQFKKALIQRRTDPWEIDIGCPQCLLKKIKMVGERKKMLSQSQFHQFWY